MHEQSWTIYDEIIARLEHYLERGGKRAGPIDRDDQWTPPMYKELYYWSEAGKAAYYASIHWTKKSEEQRAQYPECANTDCQGRNRLVAHHLNYGYRLGQERVGIDLQTLCWVCHARAHPYS